MNPATLAQYLNVNSDTVRRWAKTYASYLSSGANPAKGKSRSYTDLDVRVLMLVATLRDSGLDHHDIGDRLAELHRSEWAGLPEMPPEWSSPEELIPASRAASKTADVAQIAVLQTELENTRTAVQKAEEQAAKTERDLEAERQKVEIERQNTEQVRAELTTARVEIETLRGQVNALEARLSAYTVAYGFGQDRPLSIAVVIAVTAIAAAILVVVAVGIGAVIG